MRDAELGLLSVGGLATVNLRECVNVCVCIVTCNGLVSHPGCIKTSHSQFSWDKLHHDPDQDLMNK